MDTQIKMQKIGGAIEIGQSQGLDGEIVIIALLILAIIMFITGNGKDHDREGKNKSEE